MLPDDVYLSALHLLISDNFEGAGIELCLLISLRNLGACIVRNSRVHLSTMSFAGDTESLSDFSASLDALASVEHEESHEGNAIQHVLYVAFGLLDLVCASPLVFHISEYLWGIRRIDFSGMSVMLCAQ